MRRQFYTSDTHLGHGRALGQYARPFASLEEMDETIIRNWNETVRNDDVVRFCGDLVGASADDDEVRRYFARLNGEKHLIVGNHDEANGYVLDLPWASIRHVELVRDGSDYVFLSHYAHVTWPEARFGSLHLYGHTHGELPGTLRSLDVSTDATGFRPVLLDEARQMMAKMPEWQVQPVRWRQGAVA